MVATFNGNPSEMIISYYSPTNPSDEVNLDAFYNELSSLVRCISKHSDWIIGKTNRNGEHLTDYTLDNGLRKEEEKEELKQPAFSVKRKRRKKS